MRNTPIWIVKQEEVLEAHYASLRRSSNNASTNESQGRDALRELINRVRQQATSGKTK